MLGSNIEIFPNGEEVTIVKYLGNRSVASLIHKILNIVWFAAIAGTVAMSGASIYLGLLAPDLLSRYPADKLTLSFPGLEMVMGRAYAADIGRQLTLGGLAAATMLMITALFVLAQLRQIFAALAGDEPFSIGNARRVKYIGFAVLAGAVIEAMAGFWAGLQVMRHLSIPDVQFTARFSLSPTAVFLGLVLLILAEIFGRGAEIREEQRLTV